MIFGSFFVPAFLWTGFWRGVLSHGASCVMGQECRNHCGGKRESVLLLVGIFFFPNPPSHPSFPSLLLANLKIMIYAWKNPTHSCTWLSSKRMSHSHICSWEVNPNVLSLIDVIWESSCCHEIWGMEVNSVGTQQLMDQEHEMKGRRNPDTWSTCRKICNIALKSLVILHHALWELQNFLKFALQLLPKKHLLSTSP